MYKTALLLALVFVAQTAFSDEFKVKLHVETVDHLTDGVKVIVMHRDEEVMMQSVESDGNLKFKLEEGKLYHLQIKKAGYTDHVIHNVHAEGDTKFDVMLYKNVSATVPDGFMGANRQFVSVKEMVIPAAELEKGVNVIKQAELSSAEQKDLARIAKLAKSQEKAQKKIEKLMKKEAKVNSKIADVDKKMAAGDIASTAGEEAKLKLQKKLVKIKKTIDDWKY